MRFTSPAGKQWPQKNGVSAKPKHHLTVHSLLFSSLLKVPNIHRRNSWATAANVGYSLRLAVWPNFAQPNNILTCPEASTKVSKVLADLLRYPNPGRSRAPERRPWHHPHTLGHRNQSLAVGQGWRFWGHLATRAQHETEISETRSYLEKSLSWYKMVQACTSASR